MTDIDAALVGRLVAERFPQWAGLAIRRVDRDGWDNRTFRLGDDLLVRLPSADGYSAQVEKEQEWLPRLSPFLPLPIPSPVARVDPGPTFDRPWSVYRWLDGTPAADASIDDLPGLAVDLAGFLTALAAIDPDGGPTPGPHNFHRGGPLATYEDQTRRAIELLGPSVDAPAAWDVWRTAREAVATGPDVWLHGDVADGNLLVRDGRLSAVIDFGGCAVGDPACDRVIAWTVFDDAAREAFAASLPDDDAMWARARGWAIWKALVVSAGMSGTNSPGLGRSPAVIDRVIADHRRTRS